MLFSILRSGLSFGVMLAVLCAYTIVLLLSFSIHEFAHGYVAYRNGDLTAKNNGRLTLNPFAHIDTIGFICLILLGFGWAKPVPINPYYFNRGKKSMFAVAIAGITSNLLLAIIFALIYALIGTLAPEFLLESSSVGSVFIYYFLMGGISLNIGLAVFNLLPFYPLDGSKILELILKPDNSFLRFMQQYSGIIMILFLITGIISYIINLAVSFLGIGLVTLFTSLFELIFH